jgi:hypothetical protein
VIRTTEDENHGTETGITATIAEVVTKRIETLMDAIAEAIGATDEARLPLEAGGSRPTTDAAGATLGALPLVAAPPGLRAEIMMPQLPIRPQLRAALQTLLDGETMLDRPTLPSSIAERQAQPGSFNK